MLLRDEGLRCQMPEKWKMQKLRGNDRMDLAMLSNECFCQER